MVVLVRIPCSGHFQTRQSTPDGCRHGTFSCIQNSIRLLIPGVVEKTGGKTGSLILSMPFPLTVKAVVQRLAVFSRKHGDGKKFLPVHKLLGIALRPNVYRRSRLPHITPRAPQLAVMVLHFSSFPAVISSQSFPMVVNGFICSSSAFTSRNPMFFTLAFFPCFQLFCSVLSTF